MRLLALLGLLGTLSACGDRGHEEYFDTGDRDGDGFMAWEDCDDADPSVFPGAEEVCDGVNNDCDGWADEGVQLGFWGDHDGDGFGTIDDGVSGCEPPSGYVSNSEDCDDTNPDRWPGNQERIHDGVDQDCDGADQQLASCDVPVPIGGPVSDNGSGDSLCDLGNVVNGSLTLSGDQTGSLRALRCVCEVTGDLVIQENSALTTLGPSALLRVQGRLTVQGNPLLQSLDGLQSLRQAGAVVLTDNARLASLNGLSGLTTLDDDLELLDLPLLTDMSALNSLQSIGGDVLLMRSDSLLTFTLPVPPAGAITLRENLLLQTLGDIGAGSELPGSVSLIANSSLGSLAGLSGVQTMTGSLTLSSNNGLGSLHDLADLSTVKSLHIDGNPGLTDLRGLESLTLIDGDFELTDSRALNTLQGLNNLDRVSGTLWLVRLARIGDLDGLDRLTYVGDDLTVLGNDQLLQVDALSTLTWINRDLWVSQNLYLTDLSGLHSVGWVGGDLEVTRNPDLPDAQAEALRDAIGTANIFGQVVLMDNGG